MYNKVGPPVEGADFFGREKELEYVWSKINDGNNFILPSPRRVGKSSFAKKLLHQAKNHNWQTIEINLERTHTEIEFLKLFVAELRKLSWWSTVKKKGSRFTETLSRLKPAVEIEGVQYSMALQESKTDIYQQFEELLDHSKDTLIFLDELGVFLNEITTDENKAQPATQFLHWLRDLRQKSGSRIRWIVCSSVGIQNFTFTHKITDTINDLLPHHLKVFNEAESKTLLESLSKTSSVDLDDVIFDLIIKKIDYCLPFFLQLIFQKVESLIALENYSIDHELVEKAYEEILSESHLNTWIERIDEQYGLLGADLKMVLKHTCQKKGGTRRENLLNDLLKRHSEIEIVEDKLNTALYILTNDGYLYEASGLYSFRSPLLRDFWFERFVK